MVVEEGEGSWWACGGHGSRAPAAHAGGLSARPRAVNATRAQGRLVRLMEEWVMPLWQNGRFGHSSDPMPTLTCDGAAGS